MEKTRTCQPGFGIDRAEASEGKRIQEALASNDTFVIHGMKCLHMEERDDREKEKLAQAKRINIAVLDIPVLDTASCQGMMRLVIADIILQLQRCVDEEKRAYRRERQQAGYRIARKNKVHIGRRPKERPEQFREIGRRWLAKELSSREAAALLGVSSTTFLKWMKEPPWDEMQRKEEEGK